MLERHRTNPRRAALGGLIALYFIVGGVACGGKDAASHGPGGTGGAAGGGGAATGLPTVTVFHTNDEHGWLLPDEESQPGAVLGGAANLRGALGAAGFDPSEDLLLSSGDTWSGPAISTWVEGRSTVEVLNAMGYAAAAIGNHEFDFDLDVLGERLDEATFPFLSANIENASDGTLPDFATPYVVEEVNGLRVGLVGLTTTKSAFQAHPRFVGALAFTDYVDALEEHVPRVRAEGAHIVIVVAHVCAPSLAEAVSAATVKIDLALAGHCHDVVTFEAGSTPILSSGSAFRGFSQVDLVLDPDTGEVTPSEVTFTPVAYPAATGNPVTPDATVASLVTAWETEIDADLSMVIGYTDGGFDVASWKQANWITDAWLLENPAADLALVNFGAIREAIGPGDITLGDMVGTMPFKNVLFSIDITGAELQEELLAGASGTPNAGPYPAVAGFSFVHRGDTVDVTLADGGAFDPAATYTMITTDFVYYGGGGYGFQQHDPTPTDLGEHMRDPVVEWTQLFGTSEGNPIDDFVDPTPRDE